MKKIIASYILAFISSLFPILIKPDTSSDALFVVTLLAPLLLMAMFGVIIFILRISACRKLTLYNPGFAKQRRNYGLLMGYSALAVVISFAVWIAMFASFMNNLESMGAKGLFSFFSNIYHTYDSVIDNFRMHQIAMYIISVIGMLLFLLVEYSLLKNIQALGRGRAMGYRELFWVWCTVAVYKCITAIIQYTLYFSTPEKYMEKLMEDDMVLFCTPPNLLGMADLNAQTVIGWVLAAAFVVCLIRATVKLKRPITENTEEVQTPGDQP